MRIQFTKMSGAGNDFVVVDNRSRAIKNGAKAAKALCDRRWGIGADGLLLLEKSRKASYRMMYYNADGSYGGMCGNGGRCIARYAVLNRIAAPKHSFEALDHIYAAVVKRSLVILTMKDPRRLVLMKRIRIGGKVVRLSFVDTGSPHAVIFVDDLGRRVSLASVDVPGLGQEIRFHDSFGLVGTNVNFVERAGHNLIHVRTYERGVEAETLACGTGSIASAIVASRQWKLKPPIFVIPKSKKKLRVEFEESNSKISNVQLTGPAIVVFSGSIQL